MTRLVLLALLLPAACVPSARNGSTAAPPSIGFVDDLGDLQLFSFDFGPASGDALRDPYVAGTHVTLKAESDQPLQNFTLLSSDESVVSIGARGSAKYGPTWELVLKDAGTAELSLIDGNGAVAHARTVSVRRANRLELYAHGPALLGSAAEPIRRRMRNDGLADAEPRGPRVLRGGTATFRAQYFDDAGELHGHGVLHARSQGGITAQVIESLWSDGHDWLQVTATQSGVVEIDAGEAPLRSIQVDVADEIDIDHIELTKQSETGAKNGDTLLVLAQARTSDGAPIYGADCTFSAFKGNPVKACPSGDCRPAGIGDLYAYSYAAAQEVSLTAEHQGLSGEIQIHSGGGAVRDTASYGIGCEVGSGRAVVSPWVLALCALALVLLRRARSRHP
jgi:hypothetical protein